MTTFINLDISKYQNDFNPISTSIQDLDRYKDLDLDLDGMWLPTAQISLNLHQSLKPTIKQFFFLTRSY